MATVDYQTPNRVFLHYVFYVLFKRKGMILWGFLLVFFSMTLATQLSYPVYVGNTKVWVYKTSTQQFNFFPDIQAPTLSFSPISQAVNWVEFLNGRQIAREVVQQFGLDKYYQDRDEHPQNFRERFWYGFNWIFNSPYSFLVRRGWAAPPKERDYFLKATNVVLRDMEALKLVGLQTDILTLVIYGPTPELAQNISNYLARTLVRKVVEIEQNHASFALNYAKEHLEDVAAELKAAEEALTSFQKQAGILDLNQQQVFQVTRTNSLETEILSLQAGREKLLAKLDALQNDVKGQQQAFVSHLLLQKAMSEIQDLSVDLSMHEKNLKIVEEQYREALKRAQDLITAEFVLKKLEREANTYSQMWTLFQDRIAKLEIETVSRLKEISMEVIDPAYVSPNTSPAWPRSRDLIFLGIVGGLVLGLTLAFLAEYFNDSVRNQRELEEEVKLPVLGSVPEF